MPSYDASHFDPPAPVARVTLRNPQSGATVADVLLLVDTGADITLLPRTAVEPLGVPLLADQQYEVMGFDGSKSFAPVVVLGRTGRTPRIRISRSRRSSRISSRGVCSRTRLWCADRSSAGRR